MANMQESITTTLCLDRCAGTVFWCVSKPVEVRSSFLTDEKMSHANNHTVYAPLAFPFASWTTDTWTYLVLWLTRYPPEGRHGGLSAAYFPIAVMRSVSQVPSRPPTFPLYKARIPRSSYAPEGKLWNRTAGLVSGRADSAVGLLIIPYYPARPCFFFFFLSPYHFTHNLLKSYSLYQDTVSLYFQVEQENLFLHWHKEEPLF